MYLSYLLVDTGDNPDRPRPGRLWLRNVYHVHQRLCMGFPSPDRKEVDADFLAPYEPDDFAQGHVHASRSADNGFLFRIDPQAGASPVVPVQSAAEPDWEYAFHNAGYLLAAPPQVQPYEPRFAEGQRLRFRLLANPTKRLSKNSLGADGQPVPPGDVGKRVPVRDEQIGDWLGRRLGECADVERDGLTIQPGYVYVNKERTGQGQRLRFARFDGVLTVTDPVKFRETIESGIGSAKGFGFGLLSIAPVR